MKKSAFSQPSFAMSKPYSWLYEVEKSEKRSEKKISKIIVPAKWNYVHLIKMLHNVKINNK